MWRLEAVVIMSWQTFSRFFKPIPSKIGKLQLFVCYKRVSAHEHTRSLQRFPHM